MKNTSKTIKLSQRLQQIEKLISTPYTHIWDCCCDHGLLGLSLLNAQCAKTVHFVDIVPDLLDHIEQTLEKYWQGDRQRWQVHCVNAQALPIAQYTRDPHTDKHLIIIAGVGGELMIELLESLCEVSSQYNAEFILCPVHHNYKVRSFLIENHFALINESLVFENKRGYEILHVSTVALCALSAVGSNMWDLANPQHLEHLQKTIAHYQRIAKNPSSDVSAIINQYQALLAD